MSELRIIIRTILLILLGITLFIVVPLMGFAFLDNLNFYFNIIIWIVYLMLVVILFTKLMNDGSLESRMGKFKVQSALVKKRNFEEVELNTSKGIFGPTIREKTGGFILFCIILIILNFSIVSSKHAQWWFIIIFNSLYVGLFYISLFTNNVYIKNHKLVYKSSPEKKATEILLSDIVGVRKIYQPGGQGIPSPALSLENKVGIKFEVNIEKWHMVEVISFIKFLKDNNSYLTIDPKFEQLLLTFNTDEFASAAKSYSKEESRMMWKAALWVFVSMLFFYGLWFLALSFKKN